MKHFFFTDYFIDKFFNLNKKNENFTQKNDIFKAEVIAK